MVRLARTISYADEIVVEHRQSLKIEVPARTRDAPRLRRVGIIAIVGFVIGIAWPRLAGLSLVPAAPTDRSMESLQAEAAEQPPSVPTEAAEAKAATLPAPNERVKIGQPQITSCRDSQGKRQEKCGTLEFDRVARDRIAALAQCQAAEQAMGLLSIGFDIDFEKGKVVDVESGKSTNLPEPATNGLLACARQEVESLSLENIEHEHARYTVYYLVEFAAPRSAAGEQAIAASGRATVTWQVALIRNAPKDGEVVARILSGTRVAVTGRQGDWYRIKYDAKGSEGWVFRSAIGL